MKYLKIEWLKLKSYNTFWILLGLYVVTQTLVFYGMDSFKFTFSGEEDGMGMDFKYLRIFSFPNIWHYFSYMAGFFKIILAVLLILLMNNEFEYKTYRQHIIDGLSRTENFMLKVGTMLTISAFATLILFAEVLIFGKESEGISFFQQSDFALAFFLEVLGFLSFAFFLTHFIKRTAYVVVVLLIYMIAIEPMLGYKISEIKDHLPLQVFRSMISIPFTQQFGASVQESVPVWHMVKSLTYSTILVLIAYVYNLRRDQ